MGLSSTKHAIITGASSGLGSETAKFLANEGWKLSLVCRNERKTQNQISTIQKGNNSTISYYIADFTHLTSVKSACDKLLQNKETVDVLINNAGCLTHGRKVSKEGWEYSFAINYLTPFLLVQLLDPLLHSTSRVININSAGHAGQKLNLKDLNNYSGYEAYAKSKMANALFVIELAKRNRIAFCADPGAMATNFGGNLSFLIQMIMTLVKPFLPSAKSSAKQTLFLASEAIEKLENGGYYSNCRNRGYSLSQATINRSEKLWEETELILNQYL